MRPVLFGRSNRDDHRVVALEEVLDLEVRHLAEKYRRRLHRGTPCSSRHSDFSHAIGAGGPGILEFDGRLYRPFVVAQGAQHVFDWCVSLTEFRVRAFVHLPVLDVDVRDAVVVLLFEGSATCCGRR